MSWPLSPQTLGQSSGKMSWPPLPLPGPLLLARKLILGIEEAEDVLSPLRVAAIHTALCSFLKGGKLWNSSKELEGSQRSPLTRKGSPLLNGIPETQWHEADELPVSSWVLIPALMETK